MVELVVEVLKVDEVVEVVEDLEVEEVEVEVDEREERVESRLPVEVEVPVVVGAELRKKVHTKDQSSLLDSQS